MIHVFIGTKAQLIKMAPVMHKLQEIGIEYNFIFSGQHKATIRDIREEFKLKEPDCTLYHGADITGIFQMLLWSIRIMFSTLKNKETVWKGDTNGVVLNHGDTFSTLIGTISGRICGLDSAHIESGLRSFNIFHPFPEELTRRITFRFSNIFFAPGDWAIRNLAPYNGKKVDTKNNTLLDSLKASESAINMASVDIPKLSYGVVSIHRFENIFSRKKLLSVINILGRISNKKRLVFILHKPTHKKLQDFGLLEILKQNPNIELRPRYSYFQFIKLVKASRFVVTDGGSNQEECYYLGKPCLILRKATERQEGIGHNACLSKYEASNINNFISNTDQYRKEEKFSESSPSDIIIDNLKGYI